MSGSPSQADQKIIRVTVKAGEQIRLVDEDGNPVQAAVFLPNGADLIVTLPNGQVILLEDFYAHPEDPASLVLTDEASLSAEYTIDAADHPVALFPAQLDGGAAGGLNFGGLRDLGYTGDLNLSDPINLEAVIGFLQSPGFFSRLMDLQSLISGGAVGTDQGNDSENGSENGSDGQGGGVTPPVIPPRVVDDTGATDEDTPLDVPVVSGLLGNDVVGTSGVLQVVAINGDAAAVGVATTLSSGAELTVQADGSYIWDPNGSFEFLADGETTDDVFTYTLADGGGVGEVTITVSGVNDAPVAVVDTGATGENTSTDFDVLGNDTDVDSNDGPANFSLDTVSIASTTGLNGSLAAAGSVSIVAGQVRFDPGADFDQLELGDSSTVLVNYTMSDDSAVASSATLTITVNGAEDAPVITGTASGA
ncbi:MAG: Ig-like domain-containing protein, partial [Verrucomicrobiales bacterium]|nr:Ig-like domain-containing protein [Verrucomicrobiales bacterium]